MNRYLRIRLDSYYGKGAGLNHVKALVPEEEEHHILQRQVLPLHCFLFSCSVFFTLFSVFSAGDNRYCHASLALSCCNQQALSATQLRCVYQQAASVSVSVEA